MNSINTINRNSADKAIDASSDIVVITSLQTDTLNKAKAYIASIDFSNIINKMVKYQGWNRDHVEKLSQQYKNYLFLCIKYDKQLQLPPSEEIDEFWHNHILDTEKYHQDCQHIFGNYYHHYPYFGIDGKTNANDLHRAFLKTLAIYKQEFSEELTSVRTIFSPIISALKRALSRKL